jgi:hypothetical protein
LRKWGNRWRISRTLQMLEDLSQALPLGDGGNDPQCPPLKNGSRPKSIANTRFSARTNEQAPPGSRAPSTSDAAGGKDALLLRRV